MRRTVTLTVRVIITQLERSAYPFHHSGWSWFKCFCGHELRQSKTIAAANRLRPCADAVLKMFDRDLTLEELEQGLE